MAFERFILPGRAHKPMVTIETAGTVNFNRAMCEKHKLKPYKYAVLFFDRETKRIAVRFTNDAKEEGRMSFGQRGGGAWIYAKAFLHFYEIDYSAVRHFDLRAEEERGLIVLEPLPSLPGEAQPRRRQATEKEKG
jgi:hypothetical protein